MAWSRFDRLRVICQSDIYRFRVARTGVDGRNDAATAIAMARDDIPRRGLSDTNPARSMAVGPSWQRLTAAVRVNPHGVHLHVVRLRAGDTPAVIASRQDRNAYPTYDHGPHRGPRMSPSGSSAECVYLETCPAVEWDAIEARLFDVHC